VTLLTNISGTCISELQQKQPLNKLRTQDKQRMYTTLSRYSRFSVRLSSYAIQRKLCLWLNFLSQCRY